MKARDVVNLLAEGRGLFRAELDTGNFAFEAYGATEGSATDALVDGLVAHGRQHGLTALWFQPYREDFSIARIELGVAYRDGEPLPIT